MALPSGLGGPYLSLSPKVFHEEPMRPQHKANAASAQSCDPFSSQILPPINPEHHCRRPDLLRCPCSPLSIQGLASWNVLVEEKDTEEKSRLWAGPTKCHGRDVLGLWPSPSSWPLISLAVPMAPRGASRSRGGSHHGDTCSPHPPATAQRFQAPDWLCLS